MKHGKNYRAAAAKYDLTKKYDVPTAVKMVQDMKFAKFDETVEAHINLKLGKNATVRDTLVFPNQFRGEKKVLVFFVGKIIANLKVISTMEFLQDGEFITIQK